MSSDPYAPPPSSIGAGSRRAVLIRHEGTTEERIYPFDGDRLTVGRAPENDLRIDDDRTVARRHCRLLRSEGGFAIEDTESCGGTLVDGERLTPGRALFGGEEIVVGKTSLRFRLR